MITYRYPKAHLKKQYQPKIGMGPDDPDNRFHYKIVICKMVISSSSPFALPLAQPGVIDAHSLNFIG
jgi:hypothetical protein